MVCSCCGAPNRTRTGCSCTGGNSHHCLKKKAVVVVAVDEPEEEEPSEEEPSEDEPSEDEVVVVADDKKASSSVVIMSSVKPSADKVVVVAVDEPEEAGIRLGSWLYTPGGGWRKKWDFIPELSEDEVVVVAVDEPEEEKPSADKVVLAAKCFFGWRVITLSRPQASTASSSGSVSFDMQIFIKPLTGKTIPIDVRNNDTIAVVKDKFINHLDWLLRGFDVDDFLEKDKELWTSGRFQLLFGGKQLDDFATLEYYRIQKGSMVSMVYGLGGGGERAAGRASEVHENPFAEEDKSLASTEDRGLFEQGFYACVRASTMEDLDIEEAMNNLSIPQLNKMIAHFKTKATNENKLKFMAEMIGDGYVLKCVRLKVENSNARFLKIVAKGLWDMGTVDGTFSVDEVKQKVQSVSDFKKGQASSSMAP